MKSLDINNRIVFEKDPWNEICSIFEHQDGVEFTGLIFGYKEGNKYVITRFDYPKQQNSSGESEISAEDMAELKIRNFDYFRDYRNSSKDNQKFLGMLHSHCNFGSFISGVDRKELDEWKEEFSQFLYIVVSKLFTKPEFTIRYIDTRYTGKFITLKIPVLIPFINIKENKEERGTSIFEYPPEYEKVNVHEDRLQRKVYNYYQKYQSKYKPMIFKEGRWYSWDYNNEEYVEFSQYPQEEYGKIQGLPVKPKQSKKDKKKGKQNLQTFEILDIIRIIRDDFEYLDNLVSYLGKYLTSKQIRKIIHGEFK